MIFQKQRAFTLIEVLVAITLLSIMMSLLFLSLKICADSWQKGEAKLARTSEIATTSQFFQHYLTSAKPLTLESLKKTGELSAPLLFQGGKHSVRFAAALPASAARTGVQVFTVYQQQKQLKVSITPLFPNNLAKQTAKEELVLLTGVSDFSLTYFGSTELLANNKSPASWQEDWIAKKEQPRLVKISLSLTDGQFFPDIIINLRVVKSPTQSDNPPAL
jgi:general secretion pathway protein J